MARARIWVFDVEHGFCAFIRAPSGRTMMIDCGRAQYFSPVVYLREHELSGEELSSTYPLTKLMVTHPHDDHIQDIERVSQYFKPNILLRWAYDWPEVEEPSGGDYENLHTYVDFQNEYNTPADEPDWGTMSVSFWGLTVEEAKNLNEDKFINNSSWIAIVEIGSFKMVFPGDIEADGWVEMLNRNDFCRALAGTTVFVASHHGHSSGYTSEIYDAMGLPAFNLISCHSRDPNIESAYSTPERARGIEHGGRTRYSLTTRHDGSCLLEVSEDGQATFAFQVLDENLG